MKRKVSGVALCAMLFALCVPADAQQTAGKIPRIGFLSRDTPSGGFSRACAAQS